MQRPDKAEMSGSIPEVTTISFREEIGMKAIIQLIGIIILLMLGVGIYKLIQGDPVFLTQTFIIIGTILVAGIITTIVGMIKFNDGPFWMIEEIKEDMGY